jgi:uncharacterized protein (PEP-CTERM system associated)
MSGRRGRRGLRRPALRVGLGCTAALVLLGAGTQARAQAEAQRQGQGQDADAGAAAAAPVAAGGSGLRITPTFDTVLTYLDSNINTQGGARVGDFVTELKPGFQIRSQSGPLRGSLSYALDAINHSQSINVQGTRNPDLQNQLNAAFTAEAVPNHAYVDVTATVAQQALSAYGVQGASNLDNSANITEVANVSLTPYVKGELGSWATYKASLNASATNAYRSILGDSNIQGGSVSLASARNGALFGWGLSASRQRSDFRAGRATVDQQVLASLSMTPNPELQLIARGGREITDVASFDSQGYANWGGELHWSPSPRVTASLSGDHRYYGNSHTVLFEDRLPLSVIRFTNIRAASNGANANGVGQPVTLYDLFSARFAAVQPDPVLLDLMVRSYLQSFGLDPNALVSGGFASNAVSLQTRSDLTWSYSGRRDTFVLQAFTSSSSVIDALSAQDNQAPVRQTGFTLSASHRLTPDASATAALTELKTPSGELIAGNTLKSATLNWNCQLGRRTNASLGARYSVFDSAINPYRETAFTASLSLRF